MFAYDEAHTGGKIVIPSSNHVKIPEVPRELSTVNEESAHMSL